MRIKENIHTRQWHPLQTLVRRWTNRQMYGSTINFMRSTVVLGHNRNGHNGSRRTYNALKRTYYWPNMKKEVFFHCKNCSECILQNQTTTDTQFGTFSTPKGHMQFICMDIVGPISPVSSKGNRFCLTVIDMLTGYTMAVAIPNKSVKMIVKTYMDHVYSIFGGSSRMLMDNGSKFKNDVFDEVCDKLGIKRVYSPVNTTVKW